MEKVKAVVHDVVVVGGGIVGLATARSILVRNPDSNVILLEKENVLAGHQTSHNSGVIHSGIYYKPGSEKAKNCLSGYKLLLKYLQERGIAHDICGKLIVATESSELPRLESLFVRGQQHGLHGLRMLNSQEILEFEPHVRGLKAILVPQAGIVNYRDVANSYGQDILAMGGELRTGAAVEQMSRSESKIWTLSLADGSEVRSRWVVNAAGLYSDRIGRLNGAAEDLQIIPFRGEYYKLSQQAENKVRNLVYPVPDPDFPFLGVHFTRMIGGGVEAGPNAVLAFRREGYRLGSFHLGEFTETVLWPGFHQLVKRHWRQGLAEYRRALSKRAFTASLQKLVPSISSEDLVAGGAGVRAQACQRSGTLSDDFVIQSGQGVVNVLNAPSPAATSSLAIGQSVSNLLAGLQEITVEMERSGASL